jgi:hypothetical protein
MKTANPTPKQSHSLGIFTQEDVTDVPKEMLMTALLFNSK